MPDAADADANGAAAFEPDEKVSAGVELALETAEGDAGAYDLAEIGVDEMEPPSPTVQAALDAPAITPPLGGPRAGAGELGGGLAGRSRSSPPPDGVFPARDAKADKPSKAAAGAAASTQPPETRARAEEINSGAKIVPKIDEPVPEFLGVYVEVESWFSTFDGDIVAWLARPADEPGHEPGHESGHESGNEPGGEPGAMRMLRACLGVADTDAAGPRAYASTSQLVRDVVAATRGVLDDAGADVLGRVTEQLPSTDFGVLTLLYLLLVVHCAEQRPPLLAAGVPLTSALMRHVASLRWSLGLEDSPAESATLLSRLFMLCRVAVLATFGGGDALRQTRADVWRQYGLDAPADGEAADYASPLSYASFLHSITKRYPTFVPAEDGEDVRAHHRRMDVRYKRPPDPHDPRELVNAGTNVVPYVPHSIVEACELFKSRVKATPQVLQMWEEQERAQHVDVGAARVSNAATDAVRELYAGVMRVQKSFVQVVVDFGMQLGADAPTPGVHAALAAVWMLLRWYDVAHVLMGEYLGALLFDCQFHLMAHSFCGSHPGIVKTLLEPYSMGMFWITLAGPTAIEDAAPRLPDRGTQLLIENFNAYNLKTYTYLIGIVRLMVVNKTQRTLVVAELPVEPLKALFGVYEQELWAQLLQLLKLQVPFNGKRWRYLNMEIISAIYLYCPSKLDDDWLSGADVSQDVKDAPAQEQMLRTLIELFNKRIA